MKKIAYLTIDDGPSEDFREKVDYLESRGIKAIWFCRGEALERFPKQAIYAIQKGHIIGNHSYDHPYFSKISLEEARYQIDHTDHLINQIYLQAGIKRPIKVFRFPFLDNGSGEDYLKCNWENTNVRALQKILKELGYIQPVFEDINYEWYVNAGFDRCLNVDCTFDTFDWCLLEGEQKYSYHDLPTILARMDEMVPERGRGLNDQKSNEIILMHAFISLEDFKTLIEKLLTKKLLFELPEL